MATDIYKQGLVKRALVPGGSGICDVDAALEYMEDFKPSPFPSTLFLGGVVPKKSFLRRVVDFLFRRTS